MSEAADPPVPATTAELDLTGWKRRAHFDFFSGFDNPFFSLCADVDVTRLFRATRADPDLSFFLSSLYASARAANEIEEFRYRIRGDAVVIHDVVHPGSTVLLDDETFRFGYFTFSREFSRFHRDAREVLERIHRDGVPFDPRSQRDDQLHHSVIPWTSFTSFAHARNWGRGDSVPRVVFGRHRADGGRRVMPVSVEVHHALMDGLHVGRWFDGLQSILERAPDFD